MGKRRVKRASELRNVKRRKEEDSKLQSSVFSRVEDDISDIEVDDQNEEYMEVPEEIEDEEAEDYERMPRAFNDPDADGEEGLPIRRSDGTLQRRIIMKTSKPTNDEAANDEEDGVSGE